MNTLVTIALPCYNAERFIQLSLISIINQTYYNWKLIIIDDNSSDNSRQLIQLFLNDDRITYIFDNQNLGISARLNQMIAMCDTKYFARMDADDIMGVDRLEEQIKFMEENPSVDIVGTHAYSINERDEVLGMRITKVPLSVIGAMWHCVFIHPTIMGKTEWFKKNKYDENCVRVEDYELWLRTFQHSTFRIISKPLLFYREIDGNNREKYWLSKKNAYKIVKNNKKVSLLNKGVFLSLELLKGLLYIFLSFLGFENYILLRRFVQSKENKQAIIRKLKASTEYIR